jgi:hypothetical protein
MTAASRSATPSGRWLWVPKNETLASWPFSRIKMMRSTNMSKPPTTAAQKPLARVWV